ncbi:cytochrome P450 [Lentinula edodes]|uniref:cytochrome P450 n=1 Tax=Lentinula edodes TaxID=5353 RepID=UPI001E8DFD52|nr:cytochrome P450 [Lentinula edodes]KAH7868194.1 cytochrome P450 [Lentinula edodes]
MTFAVGDLVLLALLACFTSSRLFFSRKYPHSLPPGPKGWPLIGNAFDMPKTHSWRTFAQWGKKWGPIMSVKVLGTPFIIISNPDIADEMLGKTGSLYADRPTVQMALLTGWDRALSGARYNARFREYRKLIGKVIGTKGSMAKFYPVEDFQANMLLKRIFQNPEDPAAAIRKTAGAMVLHLTYGYKISEDRPDHFITKAEFAMEQFSDIHRTGAYLVEFFPILKYIPAWFPFTEFKRKAAECIGPCNEMADVPFAYVEEQLGKGEENNSFAADLLKDKGISSEKLTDLKWSAASFYAAGSDTTVSVVYSYLMAAILYPRVQRMAQAEVDSVVGKDRLPSFQDRDSLPYIEALVKELYRWLPIVPLAVPHRAMKDNVFQGYYIPKDSLVFVNVWHFLHDPAVYKDPSSFNPERFLGPDAEPDPIDRGLFGYGRRVCPGAHLADVSVWINIVKAVAGIEVSPAVDEKGQAKMPVPETTDGIIVRPIPFECLVKPRSEHLLHVLEEALKDGENVN